MPSPTKITDNSVTLTWPASPSDVSYYIVEKHNIDDKNGTWTVAADKVDGTTCTINGLKSEDEFYFRVIACTSSDQSEPGQSCHKVLIEGRYIKHQ